jgi:hypothetical protein
MDASGRGCLELKPSSRASPHLDHLSKANFLIQLYSVAGRLIFMRSFLSIALLLTSFVHGGPLTGIRNHWSDPYNLRPNPLYPYARFSATTFPKNISTSASRFLKNLDISPSRTWRSRFRAGALQPRQDPTGTTEQDLDTRPTPEPTGESSVETTIFITGKDDFALLLPAMSGGMFEFVLVTGAGPRSNPLLL